MAFLGCGKFDAQSDTDPLLREVDAALRNADAAQQQAMNLADSIARKAANSNDIFEKFSLELEAADAYRSLDLNRSLQHLKNAARITREKCGGSICETEVDMRLAGLYIAQGSMIKEAADIFNNIDAASLTDDARLRYYILGVQIYKALGENSFDRELRKEYLEQTNRYRDSVLMLDPHNAIMRVNLLWSQGKHSEALHIIEAEKPEFDDGRRELAPFYHQLALAYSAMEKPDSQFVYLAKAAAIDLKSGVREYLALPDLARMLEETDLDHAYEYINQSANDAYESHSDSRIKNIGPLYRTIHEKYGLKMRSRRYRAYNTLIATGYGLVIGLVVFIILRYRHNVLKRKAKLLENQKEEVDRLNESLKEMNESLEEQSRIKGAYITSFMSLSLNYLDMLDKSRAELARIAMRGNIDALISRLNSSAIVNKIISGFYANFDKAFLTLYPSFVAKLNTLLRPDMRYESANTLTTELRVYALVWMGKTESQEISKFLRCSESTVYNYRTKMRKKAINPATFEEDFKKLNESPASSVD